MNSLLLRLAFVFASLASACGLTSCYYDYPPPYYGGGGYYGPQGYYGGGSYYRHTVQYVPRVAYYPHYHDNYRQVYRGGYYPPRAYAVRGGGGYGGGQVPPRVAGAGGGGAVAPRGGARPVAVRNVAPPRQPGKVSPNAIAYQNRAKPKRR